MNDPMKIIHKYKNNNGRIQYHMYIFIGDIIDKHGMNVLEKIKDMDMHTALMAISESEINVLTKMYGEFWYEKLFNSHHIQFTIETTVQTPLKLSELEKAYGKEWVKKHYLDYNKDLQSISYSYGTKIRELKEHKVLKKLLQTRQGDDDIDDYSTYTESGHNKLDPLDGFESTNQKKRFEKWCKEDPSSDEEETDTPIFSSSESSVESDYSFESESESNSDSDEGQVGGEAPEDVADDIPMEDDDTNIEAEEFDEMVNNDLENADIFFQDFDETDKNVNETTKKIKQVISDELYDKLNKKILPFDQSNDGKMYDESLKNVYKKKYVTHQYIYKDDTIKTIKQKICCSFKNNEKYGDNVYLLPSFQYLWSEYLLNGKTDKVMIGHKWIVKNNVIILDVEPNNNLRVYEELRGKLKTLRDNIRRQGRIKPENDDNSILLDYEGYFTNNEVYLIDVMNELGVNYEPNLEDLKNMMEVYIKIYFPKIRLDDFANLLSFLRKDTPESKKQIERNKMKSFYETINNDLILENEIMRDVELVRKENPPLMKKLFGTNHVIHSAVRAYVSDKYKKIDLFRIFDNFVLSNDYPFIQYQPIDSASRSKFDEKFVLQSQNKDMIVKWFENSAYGISIKMKLADKKMNEYVTINLSENGLVVYKIQWKEEDSRTIEDTIRTYEYIRNLIHKINSENERFDVKLNIPSNSDFTFAYISTIQRITLPEKFTFIHDDLGNFSRNFFPYVALMIEPPKRQSKSTQDNEKGKYGTYLKYKRISGYENKTKIEQRILFFIRNYEYNDQSLANEISREFNLTMEQAALEINLTKEKYPNVKKSRKILRKMENIPKNKTPGIGLDILGKQRDKYKLRIAGARNKEQLENIVSFMHVFIYLYVETYLYKRPERKRMIDRLSKLVKIAMRRNKVHVYVDYDQETKNIKQIIALDKKNLGYNAGDSANSWPTECQNSGEDKRRRPKQYLDVGDLTDAGYVWKEKLDEYDFGHYERKVILDEDDNIVVPGSKKKPKGKTREVILKAAQMFTDDSGEVKHIYYTCSPEDNGKQMYIGFLGKKTASIPCCFIKDHMYSANVAKRNFYLKSLGLKVPDEEATAESSGDQMYILQDSNKLYEGRFAFLPKYMEIFINILPGNKKTIKNHHLIKTDGYYFKYGIKQDEFKYLSAVGSVFNMSVSDIKEKAISMLTSDKSKAIFTSLNNGEIRDRFSTPEAFVNFIQTNTHLEYETMNDLLTLPGVIDKNGINIIIFQKKVKVIKNTLEREKTIERYHIICQNPEEIGHLKDPKKKTILLLKDIKAYYPIVWLKKLQDTTKGVEIKNIFSYENTPNNIVNHILKYYDINCRSEFDILVEEEGIGNPIAKITAGILTDLNKKEFAPKSQYIDSIYKCRYLITYGGYIIPTLPSGCLYNIPIIPKIESCAKSFDETYDYLTKLTELTNNSLRTKPIGVYYDSEESGNKIEVKSVVLESKAYVPIKPELVEVNKLKKLNLATDKKPTDDVIDQEIIKGVNNFEVDQRVYDVAKNKYETELYQLFRLHLSYYLNETTTGLKIKEKINNLINSSKISKKNKRADIKKILYAISSKDLYKKFNELLAKSMKEEKTAQEGGDINSAIDKKWLHIRPDNQAIDYVSKQTDNHRNVCYINTDKQSCLKNQSCNWNGAKNSCILSVSPELLIEFINKVAEELVQNSLYANEILQKGTYKVSDVVSYTVFTERDGERIIMGSRSNLDNIFAEIFGKGAIPKIGKKKGRLEIKQNFDELNKENPPRLYANWYIQIIIPDKNTVFRAFTNAYYWLMHPYDDPSYRNLGFYSQLQTDISNIYKSQTVKFLVKTDTRDLDKLNMIMPYIKDQNPIDLGVRLANNLGSISSCLVELFVLGNIYNIITFIHDENYEVIYIIHPADGIVFDKRKNVGSNQSYNSFKKKINLRFQYNSKADPIPNNIEVLYPKDSNM